MRLPWMTPPSPADVADRVETVVASLPSVPISAKVATCEGGVIHGKRIKRYIDLSTTGSRAAAEISAALANNKIVQMDAPGQAELSIGAGREPVVDRSM